MLLECRIGKGFTACRCLQVVCHEVQACPMQYRFNYGAPGEKPCLVARRARWNRNQQIPFAARHKQRADGIAQGGIGS